MCGIVGFVNSDFKNAEDLIQQMTATLDHRGPDDSGHTISDFRGKVVALGHTRLSIIDLSKNGHQPFNSQCGNYSLVFNGEVYNFKEIRKELITLGYQFISDTDTEVVLQAHMEWGADAVHQFIGMFAYAFFDKGKGLLQVFRDRLGIKPLYYFKKEGAFIFASELKALCLHPAFEKNLNLNGLGHYFRLGNIPTPETIYENTFKLKPGHFLTLNVEDGSLAEETYWSIDEFNPRDVEDCDEDVVLGEIEALLDDACRRRLIADVPVGVFLSGGYDSSLVTSILQKNAVDPVNTFTIGFDDGDYNEAAQAKMIAKHLGTKHHELYCSEKDALGVIPDLPSIYDEPFGDSSAIPTLLVSRLAKEHVTVALAADGGDEVACGYSKYFFFDKYEAFLRNPIASMGGKGFANAIPSQMVAGFNAMLPSNVRQTNIVGKFEKVKRLLGGGSLSQKFVNASTYMNHQSVEKLMNLTCAKLDELEQFQILNQPRFLDEMVRMDIRTFLVDDVLTKVDRATMAVGLEGREPLLDHRLVEYMLKLPSSLKYKNQTGKYLFREILYKYVPKKLVDKPKAGFQVPLSRWLKDDLSHLLDEYLSGDRLKKDGILDHRFVSNSIKEFRSGNLDRANSLWFMLMFQMWKEKWIE